MKYPLSKNEWKWWLLCLIMVIVLCGIFGVTMTVITGDDLFVTGAAILATIFIWFKLIQPVLDRI